MPQVPLTVDTLGDLDSGIGRKAINRALEMARSDFDDRGADGKPRKVQITVHMQETESGPLTWLEVTVKVPGYRTAGTRVKKILDGAGKAQLLFQPNNADNPDQETIYDKEEES